MKPDIDRCQSTLAPEAFTTLAHLAVSLAMSAANSALEPPPGTAPCDARRSRIAGVASAFAA